MSQAYLTDQKLPLLNAPGKSFTDILYSTENSTVDEVETSYVQGRFSNDLSTKNFGGMNQQLIDNSLFIGTTELFLEIYPDTLAASIDPNDNNPEVSLQTNTFLPAGWGYQAIDYIEYTIGTMNSIERISGAANWALIAGQCQDSTKRSELWRLGGEFQNPVTAKGQFQKAARAYVILALPWSSACSKLPYPADIVTNPINVTIAFKPRDQIICGTGIKRGGFSQAKLCARQARLQDGSSLRGLMAQNPGFVYSYPAVSAKEYIVNTVGLNGTPVSVSMQNIQNADLLGIAIRIVNSDYLKFGTMGGTPVATGPPNPYANAAVTDVSLQYNGDYLYRSEGMGEMYKLVNMDGDSLKDTWDNTLVLPGLYSPWNTVDIESRLIWIDFTRTRAICLPEDIPNTKRYPTQQFILSFKTPDTSNYTVSYTYFYTAMIAAQGGVTNFYTA